MSRVSIQVFFLIAFLCASSCVVAQNNWQSGDLIFRTGTETFSNLVMTADQSGFSHVGLLINTNGKWSVLHATPEEIPGRGNKVVLDDLDFFTAPERSLQFQVFHVQSNEQQQQRAVVWAIEQLGQPFTMFDPEGVYCTTLAWRAWLQAGVDLDVVFTPINLPLAPIDKFLLPSGLIHSPLVSPVSDLIKN